MNIGREGLGNTYPTPPEVSKQFQSDTVAQGDGGSAAAATQNTTDSTATTGTTGSTGSQTPPDTSSVAQQQNLATETPRNHYEVSAMTDIGSGPFGHTVINGVVSTGDPHPVSDPALPPSGRTIVGSNAYLEWGYWLSTVSGNPARSYYVGGLDTMDSQIAALKAGGVVGYYTGTAIGRHGTGPTEMTGSFSATINFATSAVTNFNISVSGGGQSASISGASGTLGNPAPQAGPGSAQILLGSGSATVSGSATITTAGGGIAVFGSNGQAVAGGWHVIGDASRAGGVYQGTR
jgi:hypothetical protein